MHLGLVRIERALREKSKLAPAATAHPSPAANVSNVSPAVAVNMSSNSAPHPSPPPPPAFISAYFTNPLQASASPTPPPLPPPPMSNVTPTSGQTSPRSLSAFLNTNKSNSVAAVAGSNPTNSASNVAIPVFAAPPSAPPIGDTRSALFDQSVSCFSFSMFRERA